MSVLFTVGTSVANSYGYTQQDRLGRSIEFKRRYTDDYDVWAGPLDDGSIVAGMLHFTVSAYRSSVLQLCMT